MSNTKVIVLAFVAGIGFALLVKSFLIGAFLLFCFSAFLLWGYFNERFLIVAFALLSFLLGYYRMGLALDNFKNVDYGQYVQEEGVVRDVEMGENSQRFELELEEGNVLVRGDLFPQLRVGDKVLFRGRLEEPPVLDDFNYKGYLKRQGIYFVSGFPDFEITERASFSLKRIPVWLKGKIRSGLSNSVSLTERGFLEALMFGDEENIPDVWKERLNKSGTRHIAAVSGMNITILSEMVLGLFLGIGLWRRQAFWATLAFIVLYVLMMGAPASGVRAGIMGGLALLATNVGRVFDSEHLAMLTLGAMLLFNPLLLLDIGFQLSFLAFLGLVWLSPRFSKWFRKLPRWFGIRENLSSTLSAQVLVLPILLYNFGRMSVIAPLSNILILPFLPLLTIAGFVVGLAGWAWPWLGTILSLIPLVVLKFLMKVVSFTASLSFAQLKLSIPGWSIILFYSLAIWIYTREEPLYF